MGSKFKNTELVVSIPLTGDIRTLASELVYYSELLGTTVVVPIGFPTDLGSIPKVLQGIFPKDGKATYGYVVHDYLYKYGMVSRDLSDDVLEEAMEVLGVSAWRRKCVRFGLKVGGWKAWNEHRAKEGK